MSIDDLDLSVRTYNFLSKAGIKIEQLQVMTDEELRNVRGMSDKKFIEIRIALERAENLATSCKVSEVPAVAVKTEVDIYNENIGVIKKLLVDAAMDFCAVGYYLKEIRDKEQFREAGYSNIWECAWEEFGLSKSNASRHMKMNDMYSIGGNSTELDQKYIRFNKSQLQEMMSLPEEIAVTVTPDTKVTDIRKLNPNSKANKEPVAKEIEEAATQHEENEQITRVEPVEMQELEIGTFENAYEEPVAISQQEEIETVIDAEYTEVVEEPKAQQPELPKLKNMEQREQFLKNYQTWPVWCKNELTEETFYRYELPDGSAVVVKEYPTWNEWRKVDSIQTRYYLVKQGLHHFADAETNMTTLKDHMKEVQK